MELSNYFKPIDTAVLDYQSQEFRPMLGDSISAYTAEGAFPEWQKASLVMLGVEEDRASVDGHGSAPAPDFIRHKLYRLAKPHADLRLVDLGNIAAGVEVKDTYFAVIEVLQQLLEDGRTVIVLGGSDDLVFPIYKAYEVLGRVINIASVDARFNLEGGDTINSANYLQHIILQQPNYLFDYVNLGYQTYFVGSEMIQLMEELKFSTLRLGELQTNLEVAEPMVRYSDVVAVDVSAVRQSDAPAAASPSPHGLYGEQLCQLARYAGMSDKTTEAQLLETIEFLNNSPSSISRCSWVTAGWRLSSTRVSRATAGGWRCPARTRSVVSVTSPTPLCPAAMPTTSTPWKRTRYHLCGGTIIID